ncbi:MAG: hypothetical protein OJF50_002443 [Nitrospira sp.]|nr:hypothetical protein [Nitrospira sp.]
MDSFMPEFRKSAEAEDGIRHRVEVQMWMDDGRSQQGHS